MNTDVILEGYRAWGRNDREGFLAIVTPDVVLHPSGAFPGIDGPYHGVEGVGRFWDALRDVWERFEIDPRIEAIDGELALLEVRLRGRGAGSGAEVAVPLWHVLEMRGDRLARHWTFTDRETAEAKLQDLKTERPG